MTANAPNRFRSTPQFDDPPGALISPVLITFDVFGTVLDWRRGLGDHVRDAAYAWREEDFDDVLGAQAHDERSGYDAYLRIVARSLESVLGLDVANAIDIGRRAGEWPLYPDSREALRRLMSRVPCAAMTNSDVVHGEQVRRQLGFPLTHWICAEAVKTYKPSPDFWHRVAEEVGVPFGRWWWHVSAYGDYDLNVARELGLTCVFVERPHCVSGPADLRFPDLLSLAEYVDQL